MLQFSSEFFLGETRSDYFVRPLMKRRWAALMEILAEIDRVCKKYDIPYFADWGTLLGAVRHQGFIPWDDDMDIAMRREDYERFLQIAPLEFDHYEDPDAHENGERLLFHSSRTAKSEYVQQALVVSGKRINFDGGYLKRFHGFPFVVGIDIAPLDYIPGRNEETEAVLDMLEALIQVLGHGSDVWNGDGSPLNQVVAAQIRQIGDMVGHSFDWTGNIRVQTIRLLDRISSIYGRDECEYMQNMMWYPDARDRYKLYRKEWYDETVWLPFENITIPAPVEYDKVLSAVYGDYMKPVIYEDHGFKQLQEITEKGLFEGEDPAEAIERLMKYYV